jgi:Ser/Thr protein kinase RdoA (MazF antagonist)
VHLRPAPVVARVTVTLQRGIEALEAELAFAQAAAERGAPVVPPADTAIHEHDGVHVTFWRYVEHRAAEPRDAPAVGRALSELHEAVRGLELPLVRFDRLDEAEAVAAQLDHPEAALMLRAIAAARERLDELQLDEQPVHGDAHLRNAFITDQGPLWADLENVCRGPVEYDLACLAWRAKVHGPNGGQEAIAAYGPHDAALVEELMPVLAAFLVPWNVKMFERSGSLDDPYLRQRIDYLR